ncbi:MAG: VWA domain-containing protein [candidate division WOR-3 bacterium]
MVWLVMGQIEGLSLQPQGTFGGPSTEVVILIDVSGSMVKLDPEGLAREGSKMINDIADILQAPVKVNVIFYGEKSRVIALGLNPAEVKNILTDSLKAVKYEKYSDLRSALVLAKDILKKRSDKRQAFVIILTDGRIKEDDIPSGEDINNYLATLSSMASDFKDNNWNIFVFSTHEAVQSIIDLANFSGGAYEKLDNLSELSSRFINLMEEKVLRFKVDVKPNSLIKLPVEEGVAEIGLVIGFNPKERHYLKIYDPYGKEVEGKRKEGKGYIVVIVENPKPGVWKFEISKGATILLSMAIPKIISPSWEHPYTEPINVKLKLEPILPKHPDWKNFNAKIYVEYPSGKQEVYDLYDDGKNGDENPWDGIFGRNIGKFPEGEYVFTAVVSHRPTNAEIRIKKRVKLVYIPIPKIDIEGPWILSRPLKISIGISNRSGKVFTEENYTLRVVDPKGNTENVNLQRDNFGQWFGYYEKTFYPGKYKVFGAANVVVKDSNRVMRFSNITIEDTFTLCVDFYKSKIPSFLFFGQMPGRTYTHKLTLLNYCDTDIRIRFSYLRSVFSDTLKDKTISESQRPQFEKVEPIEIPPSKGQPTAAYVNLKWIIPREAKSGTYDIVLKGTQAPSYRPIEIRYPSKVGSWKQVWITFVGMGVLVVGGGFAAWHFTR